MRAIFTIILFSTFLLLQAQDVYQWKGKDYYVYKGRVELTEIGYNSPKSWSYKTYRTEVKNSIFHSKSKKMKYERHYLTAGIIPDLNPLQDGEYVIFYKKVKSTDENQVAIAFSLKNNETEGVAQWYNEDGTVIQEGNYINGFKEGVWQKFTDKGILFEQKNFKNGLLHGEKVVYNWNSKILVKKLNYTDGDKDGQQAYYGIDGKIFRTELFNNGIELNSQRYYDNGNLKSQTIEDTIDGFDTELTYYIDGRTKDSIIHHLESPYGFYYSGYKYKDAVWKQYGYYNYGSEKAKVYRFNSDGELKSIVYNGGYDKIYVDSSMNKKGVFEKVFEEDKINDSTYRLRIEDNEVIGKRKYKITTKEYSYFVNGLFEQSMVYHLVNNNDTIVKEFQKYKNNYLYDLKKDSLVLMKSIWSKNANSLNLEYFDTGDSSTTNLYYEYFDNGNLRVYDQQSRVLNDYPDFPTTTSDSCIVYSNDEKSYYTVSKYRLKLMIDNKEIDGFYKFEMGSYYSSYLFNVESNQISISPSVAKKWVPYEILELGTFLPTSGSFDQGVQEGIWTFENNNTKEIIKVSFEGGMASGSVENVKVEFEYDELSEIKNYNWDDKNYKTKKATKFSSVNFTLKNEEKIGVENVNYKNGKSFKKSYYENGIATSEIKLTPYGDTISIANWTIEGRLTSLMQNNSKRTYTKLWTVEDTAFAFFIGESKVQDTLKLVESSLVGKTACRNEIGEIEAIYHFNERSTCVENQKKDYFFNFGASFQLVTGTHYVFIDRFINNKKCYSGYVSLGRYIKRSPYFEATEIVDYDSYPNNFIDTLKTYYANGHIHEIAFSPSKNAKKTEQYYKEFDLKGRLIGEGYFNYFSFEIDCHKDDRVYLPEFDVHFLNYFDENGNQTLFDGTGNILRKVNGITVYEGECDNGKRIGLWKFYDGNGNLTSFGNYDSGKKEGLWYSGDLKHVHFVSECVELSDPNYSEIIKNLESDIQIEKTIYKNGEVIFDERFRRD